jgi:3-methyladenine DNA glycosylase AlkD
MTANEIRVKLKSLGSPERAEVSKRYFKTGPGQYGEGDIFYGNSAAELRGLARDCQALAEAEILKLLRSPFHEERAVALLIFVRRFAKADPATRKRIYELYLAHTAFINNWDLVDVSAPHVVGAYLADKSRKPLYSLARSRSLWERRISIVATFHFIRQNDFSDTLAIARHLLADKEDLIHKAAGWMLREVGKRDTDAARTFLAEHYQRMPRTMLRYAIERFPEAERQAYLKGLI